MTLAPLTKPESDPKPGNDDGKVPEDTRTADYIKHCCQGHLPYDPKCEVCIMGSMRSKPATRKLTEGEQKIKGYHQCLESVSTDVMKFNDKDVDGNIAVSGVYIPKASYGDCLPLSSMTFIAKNRDWGDLQCENNWFAGLWGACA